jgi:peptidoglycan DL-endopeptidase CwlO
MATLTASPARSAVGGPLSPRGNAATARRAAVVLAGIVGILLSVLAVVPAQAAPSTAAEAGRLMAARSHDLEVMTEKFDAARVRLAAEERLVRSATAKMKAAYVVLGTAQNQVRGIARSAYTGTGSNAFATMMTSKDATDFVDRMTTLQTIAGHQDVVLQTAVAASHVAAQAQATAHGAAVAARAQYDALAGQQASIKKQVAAFTADFNRLSAAEKQAAVAEAERGAVGGADGGAVGGATRASRADRPDLAPSGPIVASSQAAQMAVDTALAQRGKPYVWAADGPSSFDCSGLVEYAYGAAGIGLPHSSLMQSQMGRAVSRSELRPGDLVFFYSPVSHVGIYIGNGEMVHAPTTGDVVKISSIDVMGYFAGARRIAG